jgi:hypothetical protein
MATFAMWLTVIFGLLFFASVFAFAYYRSRPLIVAPRMTHEYPLRFKHKNGETEYKLTEFPPDIDVVIVFNNSIVQPKKCTLKPVALQKDNGNKWAYELDFEESDQVNAQMEKNGKIMVRKRERRTFLQEFNGKVIPSDNVYEILVRLYVQYYNIPLKQNLGTLFDTLSDRLKLKLEPAGINCNKTLQQMNIYADNNETVAKLSGVGKLLVGRSHKGFRWPSLFGAGNSNDPY